MIDIHSHILPDLDDGAENVEDALAMVRIAVQDGIRTMVATPHMLNGAFDVTAAAARERYGTLVGAVEEAGLDVRILLGAEVHLGIDMVGAVERGEAFTLGEGRAILLELPSGSIPTGTEEAIFELQSAGHPVVLAHPERNHELIAKPDRAEKLVERGVRLQITARSVTGGFGYRPKKTARRWLKRGIVDFLASDAHHPRGRVPVLSEAVRWIEKKHGAATAEALVTTNPAGILNLGTEAG